jgi:hypothetical protein
MSRTNINYPLATRSERRTARLLEYLVEDTTECPPWSKELKQPYTCGVRSCSFCWMYYIDLGDE